MFDPQCIESYKYVTSKAEISVTKSPLQPPNPYPKCIHRHGYASACAHSYITHTHAESCVGTPAWDMMVRHWLLNMPCHVSYHVSSTCFSVLSFLSFISSSSSSLPRAIAVLLPLHWLQAVWTLLVLAFPIQCIMSREEKGAPLRESRTDLSMRNYPELHPYSAAWLWGRGSFQM